MVPSFLSVFKLGKNCVTVLNYVNYAMDRYWAVITKTDDVFLILTNWLCEKYVKWISRWRCCPFQQLIAKTFFLGKAQGNANNKNAKNKKNSSWYHLGWSLAFPCAFPSRTVHVINCWNGRARVVLDIHTITCLSIWHRDQACPFTS